MKRKLINAAITFALFPLASHVFAAQMSPQLAVETLKLSELAATYSKDKVAKATQGKSTSQADALLLDMGVISVRDLSDNATLSYKLTRFVNDQQDLSENYIGNISDKNIIERVVKTWNKSTVIQDKDTLALLNSFIDNGYTTGYNVIDVNHASNFNPELSLRYGHNNIQHAVQLLLLMMSEGFDPKVQFVPKSSAFLYLPEWGEPSYTVTTLASGKMVSVEKEYNIDFEFQNTERKDAFMDLINQYAKKDSADEQGLIYEAWWQPFYRSYTEMPKYEVLTENQIKMGQYQVDLMSLPKNAKQQAEQIRSAANQFDVESVKVWVNPSFYRYMNGDFK